MKKTRYQRVKVNDGKQKLVKRDDYRLRGGENVQGQPKEDKIRSAYAKRKYFLSSLTLEKSDFKRPFIFLAEHAILVNDILTTVPSFTPSSHPSIIPSGTISEHPSREPSFVPSSSPSKLPSLVPSVLPTRQPTNLPSKTPSNEPSLAPSMIPTGLPSNKPSFDPSIYPSKHPSKLPSNHPTGFPSTYPSSLPTSHPSRGPNNEPSLGPSHHPSVLPSQHFLQLPSLYSEDISAENSTRLEFKVFPTISFCFGLLFWSYLFAKCLTKRNDKRQQLALNETDASTNTLSSISTNDDSLFPHKTHSCASLDVSSSETPYPQLHHSRIVAFPIISQNSKESSAYHENMSKEEAKSFDNDIISFICSFSDE